MPGNTLLLFSYFKLHGDGLHLAWSDDACLWHALNNDLIFLKPAAGKEKIMRDPCIIYGRDKKFHLVWTAGWNERGIGYTHSDDLLSWSPQQYLPVMEHEEKARNCWAPEIFFDDTLDHYLIYWSSTIYGSFPETQPYGDNGYNHRLYYVTTKDFRSFSTTKLLYDGGFNTIDGNIVRDGKRYLLFMKNETLIPPQKNIRMAVGQTPYSFGQAGQPLTPNHYWAEGPSALKFNGEWFVYFDKYKINRIGAIHSKDLLRWTEISDKIIFPSGAQHGSVLTCPSAVIQHIIRKFSHASASS